MAAERFPLSDPTLPIDPEAATRALGVALAARHADNPAAAPVLQLGELAAHLVAASQGHGGAVTSGPLAGRDVEELARLAAATVAELPGTGLPADGSGVLVPVTPGLTLDRCHISIHGAVEIEGGTVWGDRHLDLAAAAVGVAARFGNAVVAPLVDAYGMDAIDLRTLDTCQQLIAVAAEVGWPELTGG